MRPRTYRSFHAEDLLLERDRPSIFSPPERTNSAAAERSSHNNYALRLRALKIDILCEAILFISDSLSPQPSYCDIIYERGLIIA